MTTTFRLEIITPEKAAEYLALSAGNRHVSDRVVLGYAESMRRGEWYVTNQGLGFDEAGKLVDGHHRLHAVVLAGVPVEALVVRGMVPAARGAIDGGRIRSLPDKLKMERGTSHTHARVGYLQQCAWLLTGDYVPMRTLDEYDRWMALFKGGIEAAVVALATGKLFRNAPVAGSLAFAHRTHPEATEAFMVALRDGENLKLGDPALTLRNFLLAHAHTGGKKLDRWAGGRKTLAALLAHVEGRKLHKLQDGDAGVTYFRRAYATRAVSKVASAWGQPGAKGKAEAA